MCWPLLCLCRPLMIFERSLDLNTESCLGKQVRYHLSHPSPYLLSHPSPYQHRHPSPLQLSHSSHLQLSHSSPNQRSQPFPYLLSYATHRQRTQPSVPLVTQPLLPLSFFYKSIFFYHANNILDFIPLTAIAVQWVKIQNKTFLTSFSTRTAS